MNAGKSREIVPLADRWTDKLGEVAYNASGGSYLLRKAELEAYTAPPRLAPLVDNIRNYFERTGTTQVEIDKLLAAGKRRIRTSMKEASNDGVHVTDARKLKADLKPDVTQLITEGPGIAFKTVDSAIKAWEWNSEDGFHLFRLPLGELGSTDAVVQAIVGQLREGESLDYADLVSSGQQARDDFSAAVTGMASQLDADDTKVPKLKRYDRAARTTLADPDAYTEAHFIRLDATGPQYSRIMSVLAVKGHDGAWSAIVAENAA